MGKITYVDWEEVYKVWKSSTNNWLEIKFKRDECIWNGMITKMYFSKRDDNVIGFDVYIY